MYYKPQWIIKAQNALNKVMNAIVNNPLSNWIKETFYLLFGVPYPEYLYNPEAKDYVVRYLKGKTEDGKPLVEVSTTPDIKYALDVSKVAFYKKRYMLYAINKTWKLQGGEGEYRFKRILTYDAKPS